ncbi:MAG: low molecular weight phosphatase family protein [Candidatus Acidiferrales bacterium]
MRVVFVCLGNSCRSQMAEAWARHLGAGRVEALSAGVRALGFIATETREVMAEKGVSMDGQRSKGFDAIDWPQVDVLVNMSGFPTRDVVPDFKGKCLDWKIADPYMDPLETYRSVRDLLERKVRKLLEELPPAKQT